MAQKHTWPRQKVTIKITQAQADLILENDCIDQEVLDSLDFSEPHAGIVASGQKPIRANSQINAIQKPSYSTQRGQAHRKVSTT